MTKTFTLDNDDCTKLTKWQDAIKEIHGEYGQYEYRFSPNGIGMGIYVYSELAKATLDLTDVSKW